MDQDTPDSEKSEDEDSDMASVSDDDDEESSELDEEESRKRRYECLDDINELESQFSELKEQLYKERSSQIDDKLEEVRAGKAAEYLDPLAELQDDMRVRTQVAGILKELKIQNIRNKYESEDKIRRLEEDRHNIDITSDLWESQTTKKKRRSSLGYSPDRRRRPVTVSGPYIIYLLKDIDIIEDWTAIKKAMKQNEKKKKEQKHPYSARYDDGKLYYEGDWYMKGHHIIIENKEDS